MPLKQDHPSNIMTAYDLFSRRLDSAVESRNSVIELVVVVLCLSITTGVVLHYAFDEQGDSRIPGLIISIIILIITTLILIFYKLRFRHLNNSLLVSNTHKVIPGNPPLNTNQAINDMWNNFMSDILSIKQEKGEFASSIAPLGKNKNFEYTIEIDGEIINVGNDDYKFTSYDSTNHNLLDQKKFSGTFYYSKNKKSTAMIEFDIIFLVYSYKNNNTVCCNTNVLAIIKKPFAPLSPELTQDFVLIMRNSINALESTIV